MTKEALKKWAHFDIFASYTNSNVDANTTPRLDNKEVDEFMNKACNRGEFEDRTHARAYLENFYREWTKVCGEVDSLLDSRVI